MGQENGVERMNKKKKVKQTDFVCLCECECVCVRERERRGGGKKYIIGRYSYIANDTKRKN